MLRPYKRQSQSVWPVWANLAFCGAALVFAHALTMLSPRGIVTRSHRAHPTRGGRHSRFVAALSRTAAPKLSIIHSWPAHFAHRYVDADDGAVMAGL